MKLLTKELKKELPTHKEADKMNDPEVICKFFHPMSDWTWYAISYNPETKTFFGVVDGLVVEMGEFSLEELQGVSVYGLGIERDKFWEKITLSELKEKLH